MPAFGYGGSYQPQSATPVQGNPGSRAAYQALQSSAINQPAFGIDPNRTDDRFRAVGGGQGNWQWSVMDDPNNPYAKPQYYDELRNTYFQNLGTMKLLQSGPENVVRNFDYQSARPQNFALQTKSGPKAMSFDDVVNDYQRYLTSYNELEKRGLLAGNKWDEFTPAGRARMESAWNKLSAAVTPRFVQQGSLTFSSGRQL